MLPKGFEKSQEVVSQYTMGHLKKDKSSVKIRILSDFIQGKSVWGLKDGEKYPYRYKLGENIPVANIGVNDRGEPNRVLTFIAAVVWNYTTNQVEVLELTKRTIVDAIFDFENDEDWGDSKNYDLKISRSGEGFSDTKYTVVPSNKGDFTKIVDWKGVKLEALYSGENPFEGFKSNVSVEGEINVEDVSNDIPF